jgi:glucan 1,3-beta-glucosidase
MWLNGGSERSGARKLSSKPDPARYSKSPAGGSRPTAGSRGPAHAVGSASGRVHGTDKPELVAPQLPAADRERLDQAFRAALARGIHGLCFSPYLQGQQPGSQIAEAQIHERLAIVREHTRWVRSFSCTDGHEQTPRIAHSMGLKTLVGAWLGTNAAINERELAGVIAVARAGHADIVAVGNEVLLRGDLSEDELIGHIERVKHALPGVPVGYVDAYYLFEEHPRIAAVCDVVMTNCYPFWEGCPREEALPYMQQMLARTRAAAPGKRILISETGWPDQGSPFQGAVPGHEAAMQYFVDTAAWAESEGIEWFHFAAFDEAWKVGTEGDVGAFWGLWDKDARLKFG